jgi:hypothetical protein
MFEFFCENFFLSRIGKVKWNSTILILHFDNFSLNKGRIFQLIVE